MYISQLVATSQSSITSTYLGNTKSPKHELHLVRFTDYSISLPQSFEIYSFEKIQFLDRRRFRSRDVPHDKRSKAPGFVGMSF